MSAINFLLEVTSKLSIFKLLFILLLLLLHVELVSIRLIGVGLFSSGLSVARVLSTHHRRVITRLLLHESPRVPYLLLKLLLGDSILVQLLLPKNLSRHIGISSSDTLSLIFSSILVLLREIDPRIIALIHFLFLFNSLRVPSARRESLFERLLLQDPVIHEVEVEALPHE